MVQTTSCFSRTYNSVSARGAEADTDFYAEFRPINQKAHNSRMSFVDCDDICIISVQDRGGTEMRGAVNEDAMVAVFIWGDGTRLNGRRQDHPVLIVLGPGTELTTEQPGESRYLRVGVRGAAFERLEGRISRNVNAHPWKHAGVSRPRCTAKAEWRLQQRLLHAVAFAESATRRDVDPGPALAVSVNEAAAALTSALAGIEGLEEHQVSGNGARRRLVAKALDILEASPDEPIAVSAVCESLGVSDRSLQRAFNERLGVGLRAYERERRLRCVHGAILARGDRRSITDIAMSFGFWHLGRFSAAYAALFGCLPSETQRCIWGKQPERQNERLPDLRAS